MQRLVMMIPVISIVAALAAVMLAVWLLLRKGAPGRGVLAAALVVLALLELFDAASLALASPTLPWKRLSLLAEALLPMFWLRYAMTFGRDMTSRQRSPFILGMQLLAPLLLVAASLLPINRFYYAPDFPQEPLLFLGDWGFVFYLFLLALLVIPLINLELTLVTASAPARWQIKYEILGSALILAVLLFYYSQGLLYRSINMQLTPVRSVGLIIGALLIFFSRMRRGEKVAVSISSQMAFRSMALFAVGIYLVWLGLIGEGMRYFDTQGKQTVLILIGFLTGLALLTAFLSEKFRRRLRVFLHKNFYANKYDYRVQWLEFTRRLASARTGEELLQSILSAYCVTFGTEGAALFLPAAEGEAFSCVARYEVDPIEQQLSRDNPLIRYLVETGWVFQRGDATDDALLEPNRELFELHRFSFAIPLTAPSGIEGVILLGMPINAEEGYSYEDFDLMKTLAHQAYSAILNLRLADQLSRAREMAAIGKIATFVVHDLKNLVSTLSLVTDNAREHIGNPEFQQDMLASIANTVGKMKGLIARLRNLQDPERGSLLPLDLLKVARETVSLLAAPEVSVHGESAEALCDHDELQKVILNLVMNALEASEKGRPVEVAVGADTMAWLRVTDSGCGMSEHFIKNELFRPFRTTKSKGLGIGLYQCRQVVESYGGRIEVISREGGGSSFKVLLPKGEDASLLQG